MFAPRASRPLSCSPPLVLISRPPETMLRLQLTEPPSGKLLQVLTEQNGGAAARFSAQLLSAAAAATAGHRVECSASDVGADGATG